MERKEKKIQTQKINGVQIQIDHFNTFQSLFPFHTNQRFSIYKFNFKLIDKKARN